MDGNSTRPKPQKHERLCQEIIKTVTVLKEGVKAWGGGEPFRVMLADLRELARLDAPDHVMERVYGAIAGGWDAIIQRATDLADVDVATQYAAELLRAVYENRTGSQVPSALMLRKDSITLVIHWLYTSAKRGEETEGVYIRGHLRSRAVVVLVQVYLVDSHAYWFLECLHARVGMRRGEWADAMSRLVREVCPRIGLETQNLRDFTCGGGLVELVIRLTCAVLGGRRLPWDARAVKLFMWMGTVLTSLLNSVCQYSPDEEVWCLIAAGLAQVVGLACATRPRKMVRPLVQTGLFLALARAYRSTSGDGTHHLVILSLEGSLGHLIPYIPFSPNSVRGHPCVPLSNDPVVRLAWEVLHIGWSMTGLPSISPDILCSNSKHVSRVGGDCDVQRCSGCQEVVYCSGKCQQEDWQRYHSKECKAALGKTLYRASDSGESFKCEQLKLIQYLVNVKLPRLPTFFDLTYTSTMPVERNEAPSWIDRDSIDDARVTNWERDMGEGTHRVQVLFRVNRDLVSEVYAFLTGSPSGDGYKVTHAIFRYQ
ncbi:hypothetical protein D9611_008456 [Ephemerocybe angulata]|uniref:MYND-type domain-containing protein n=1 Tax=Ephemerocybe angulata TaxID=980116 RepID=A0A8H5BIV8_9AGAR|nr:hypothetical protein D9611_008456 [Tulosesus angulatus]